MGELRSRLGCQVKLTKELDGMVAKLPSATRNMYVDGELLSRPTGPKPWLGCLWNMVLMRNREEVEDELIERHAYLQLLPTDRERLYTGKKTSEYETMRRRCTLSRAQALRPFVRGIHLCSPPPRAPAKLIIAAASISLQNPQQVPIARIQEPACRLTIGVGEHRNDAVSPVIGIT